LIVAPHPAGAVAVTQADHAVMCAELADAWGSLGDSPAAGDVRLAAEQHELGWAEFDAAPPLDSNTGLPFARTDLHFRHYLDLQVAGPRILGANSPYAGLLASMQYASFYRRPRGLGLLRADGRRLRSFFIQTSRLQAELAARAGVEIDDPQTVREARLVRCWDGLSHDLLLERAPCTRRDVPTAAADLAELRLERRGASVTITPWPFAPSRVEVHARGRLLTRTSSSEAELHEALAAAEIVTLTYALVPAV
jgi:Protein of unknown function (DUF3891)